jgi:energy-coupling factor transporter ATP-binding protein EcfA2
MAIAQSEQITSCLRGALDRGLLPAEGEATGRRLLKQLNTPARVAVVGFPGSGKTSLCNMLAGQAAMPDLAGVPVVELVFGKRLHAVIEGQEGHTRTIEGIATPEDCPPGTVRVRQHLRNKALRGRHYTEIELPEAIEAQRDLLEWMALRADLAIWCSTRFDDRERALWAAMPDRLKDHGFLALTMADRLHMQGTLTARIEALEPVVSEEFLSLFPIATRQAIAAQAGDTGRNEPLWQASGAEALCNGLDAQIELDRRADVDHIHALLERYDIAPGDDDAATPASPVAPVGGGPSQQVMEQALDMLQGCAEDLMRGPPTGDDESSDRVLERCAQTAEDLAALLAQADGTDPVFRAIRDDANEGEQMLLLLRLERGQTAAEDALTVLLQMKKDMAEKSAEHLGG